MIGNDVVDLQLAAIQSNWRRKGFLHKVFSAREREGISKFEDPQIGVWLFWSMKEAAYKVHQRRYNLPPRLNWQAQQCTTLYQNQSLVYGEVQVGKALYHSFSEISSERIFTTAQKCSEQPVHSEVFAGSSSEAGERLTATFKTVFSSNFDVIKLKKDAFGIPFLEGENKRLFSNFSLTAHGRYAAYSLALINCEIPVKHL